jgi:hypothetical protein
MKTTKEARRREDRVLREIWRAGGSGCWVPSKIILLRRIHRFVHVSSGGDCPDLKTDRGNGVSLFHLMALRRPLKSLRASNRKHEMSLSFRKPFSEIQTREGLTRRAPSSPIGAGGSWLRFVMLLWNWWPLLAVEVGRRLEDRRSRSRRRRKLRRRLSWLSPGRGDLLAQVCGHGISGRHCSCGLSRGRWESSGYEDLCDAVDWCRWLVCNVCFWYLKACKFSINDTEQRWMVTLMNKSHWR